jgi:HEAT repeat protein
MSLLENARDEKARGPLWQLARSTGARGDLRLAAGTALGVIFTNGLAGEVRELTNRDRADDPLSGLIAVRMLASHQDSESISLLQQLARDKNTAVQALALKRLGQIDHKLAASFALDPQSRETFSVKHPDANVRLALIESLYSLSDAQAISVLRAFLDDPHPGNRTTAGDALYHLAQNNAEFRDAVLQELLGALSETSWRTLERAAIVAGGLDGEASADALIRLLAHPRKEVAVASAWALKEIAVEATLPVVLNRLKENLDTRHDFNTEQGRALTEIAESQSQHLNEQLGLMKYPAAEASFRRLIPPMDPNRQLNDPLTRATAIWALGLIHEDKPNPELTALLMGRLNMIYDMFNPEPLIVGEASAYAAGWMRDASGLKDLQTYAGRSGVERNVPHAAAWAVGRITGNTIP